MEDTLRDDIKKLIKNYQFEVLILVLMEDTLRAVNHFTTHPEAMS